MKILVFSYCFIVLRRQDVLACGFAWASVSSFAAKQPFAPHIPRSGVPENCPPLSVPFIVYDADGDWRMGVSTASYQFRA